MFRDRNDPLELYNDLELVQRFRFSRSAILRITEFIFDRLNSTDRSHAAHPHVQVCVALQFFASGTFQIICGDGVHVSQPSACIRAVALGLQSIYSKFICMPGSTDKATIKSQFYELAHLPGVLGLVDGTHVRIQKPSENEADYVNRHYISVSLMVDFPMYWQDSPVQYMTHEFGSSLRLEHMWRITFWLASIY